MVFLVCLVCFGCVTVKLLHMGVGVNDCCWEYSLQFSLPFFDARINDFVRFLVRGVVHG